MCIKNNSYDLLVDFAQENTNTSKEICRKASTRFKTIHGISFGMGAEKFTLDEKPEEEKYDFAFLGTLPGIGNRRSIILEYLSKRYSVCPLMDHIWGDKKKEVYESAKIFLNLHYEEARWNEAARLYDYAINRRFTMSERITDSYPFIEGEDYISFFLSDLCNKADYYLTHPEERKRIVDSAYNRATVYDYSVPVKRLMDEIILMKYEKEIGINKKRRKSFLNR